MKIIKITILSVIVTILSCTKGRVNYETQYLQVENLTTHNVSLIIFNKYDLYDKKDTTSYRTRLCGGLALGSAEC